MQIGIIGLGRMGGNMTLRLTRGGHACVVFDPDAAAREAAASHGAVAVTSVEALVERLQPPRAVWVMVPAGEPTQAVIDDLAERLMEDDVIVDGGNTHFEDDIRRAAVLRRRGIHYLDVGTSGGVWGVERGYCLMIGGDRPIFERLRPIFATLAPGPGDLPRTAGREGSPRDAECGFAHCGKTGAGHFVKMVHNGIEYGLMQAYAEGFDILAHAADDDLPPERRLPIDVGQVAELWRRGSVIGSWLLDLTALALSEDPALERYGGFVSDSGEGRWTIETAIEQAVPTPVLAAALFARFRSRRTSGFADKLLSAMRYKFGGHTEPAKER